MIALFALLCGTAFAEAHIDAGLVIRVDDREAAVQTIVADAEARGGWFSELSESQVSVRIPVDQARDFVDKARGLGTVDDYSWNSTSLTSEIEDLEGRLAARRDVLGKYMSILEGAKAEAVVTVEREVTKVVAEIEQIEGRLKVLHHQAEYASATVSFQYRDRAAPSRDGTSSFAWLNTLNVADLLYAFQYGYPAEKSGVSATAPQGFAPYGKANRFRAVSPDDVVYRIRRADNDPVAEIDFWKEAMTSRMKDAGYHVVAEETVTAGGHSGALLELGAANGEQDVRYLLVVFVDGKDLVIVEASGEAKVFDARRDAILTAVQTIAF